MENAYVPPPLPWGMDAEGYEAFMLTNRERLARNMVASLIAHAAQKPERVVVASMESISTSGWGKGVEIWEAPEIKDRLLSKGLSSEAWKKIEGNGAESGKPWDHCNGHMFLKYAIPRLCLGRRVLISDDDVIFRGPCFELFESDANMVFVEDPPGRYGPESVKLFLDEGWAKEAPKKPFVCAGLYMMKRNEDNPKLWEEVVNRVILNARHHRDEQSAVGMESLTGSIEVLHPPKYIHGGHATEGWVVKDCRAWIDKPELVHAAWGLGYLKESPHMLPDLVGYNTIEDPRLGFFYQTINRGKATEFVLENVRRHYPKAPIILVADGADADCSTLAKKWQCTYFRLDKRIGNGATTGYPDLSNRLRAVEVIRHACNMINTDWVMILEDDVYLRDKVLEPRYSIAGPSGHFVPEIIDIIKPRNPYFTADCGACGGSLFRRKTALKCFNLRDFHHITCCPRTAGPDTLFTCLFEINGWTFGVSPSHCETTEKGWERDRRAVVHQYKKLYNPEQMEIVQQERRRQQEAHRLRLEKGTHA